MVLLDLLKKRESIRKYIDLKVDREKIDRCLEAARLSPSACNSQPWRFVIVDDPELTPKIAEATFSKLISFNKFTKTSPAFAVIIAENRNLSSKFGGMAKGIPYYLIDIGIAAEHFCLQAVEEGLGTCMLGWFNEKKIKELLEIPKKEKVALVITLGYHENTNPRKKIRKDLDSIRSYNKY
ncbi:nitroreductase family protein [Wukongibacter baidiensis]|uniref:nitroreductase family protein n=1 Tax=Wukongibacter baidiensis TaxID=1723361 RepID=UPI003D7F6D55